MVGLDLLDRLGVELYGDTDPTARLHDDEPMKIRKKGSGYELALHLPFAGKSDLDLMRKGDDLYVRVGSYKRTFLLPSVLTRLDRWSSDPCLQNKRGLSDTVAHLGLRLQGISQDRLASDLLWSGLVVSRRNAAERRTFGSWRQRDTKPGPKSG